MLDTRKHFNKNWKRSEGSKKPKLNKIMINFMLEQQKEERY